MFVDASDMPDCSSALIYSTWFIYCLQTVSTSNFIILPFFFFMRCKHRRTQAVLAFCRSVANAFASILCIGPLGHTCTSIYIYIYVCTSISARSSRTAFTRIVIYTWRRSVASVVSFVLFAVRFFLFAQIAQTAAHFCWFLYSSFIFLWQILGLPSFFLTFFLFFFLTSSNSNSSSSSLTGTSPAHIGYALLAASAFEIVQISRPRDSFSPSSA